MNKSIYQIAVECKEFSNKNVKWFNQTINSTRWFCVFGANKSFENLLLSLCEAISEKYPYISEKLKEHTLL